MASQDKDDAKPSANKSTITPVLITISLIIALVAIILSAFTWWQSTVGSHNKSSREIALLSKTIEKSQLQNQAETRVLQSQLLQQQQNINNLQNQLSRINNLTSNSAQQKALDQAAYFVNMANLYLTIDNDINSSKRLLQQAKEQLSTFQNSNLLVIKQNLNKDIAALNAIPNTNIVEIINQLDNIDQQIQQLPLLPTNAHIKEQQKNANQAADEDTANLPWYKKIWRSITDLKNLFIVRRIDKPVMPLLSPEQQAYLKANIKTKLLQAQWAAIHRNTTLYKANLLLVVGWIDDYFHDKNATANITNKIRGLSNINVSPTLPDLSATLNAIDQVLSTKTLPNQPSKTPPNLNNDPAKTPITPQQPSRKKKKTDSLKPTNNTGVEI